MKILYLLINIGTILFPFLFSFHKKFPFYREWKYFFPANLFIGTIFLFWDVLYTNWGVWGFNQKYHLDIKIMGLPIEEVLFFFCIPYACTFIYFVLKSLNIEIIKSRWVNFNGALLSVCALCITVVIIFWGELYTMIAFLLTAITLLFLVLFPPKHIQKMLLAYLVSTLPFLLVNGLLTGLWIDEQVVWYNDFENLGIRTATIPVDDYFYSFVLLMWNFILYEKVKLWAKR